VSGCLRKSTRRPQALMSYLIKPISDQLSRMFRER
jgi:hypothetical protein